MQVKHILFLLIFCSGYILVSAQNDVCNPTTEVDTAGFEGVAFFNYGSTSKSKNQRYQTAFALGQVFTGYIDNSSNNSTVGFYGRYLLPPFGLKVEATQGDLLDRIQLSWEIDALGPLSTEGFNIYRDGIFLATVGPNIRNYNDFNVIAGVAYQYSVRGVNAYGEGAESFALGFQVPNGVVTGWINTLSGSPVPNAQVTLMPMQGFSARFGAEDQAISAISADSTFLPENGDWTITFWSKTDTATNNAKIISIGEILLYVRAINSNTGTEGIEVANLPGAAPFLSAPFADSLKHSWNHVTLSFEKENQILRIYINGQLINQAIFMNMATQGEVASSEIFLKLGNTGDPGGWKGKLDELRIYHTLLGELDIPEIMHGTASSQTQGLYYYWKMDEELGNKSYDIKNRLKLFFCGAEFDTDRPPVRTAGKTNDEGYYRIESASYGTGTTFIADPSKSFYLHKSVKLVKSQSGQVSIPDFPLPKRSTIEVWVNNAGSAGIQTILSKKSPSNDLKLFLESSGINQVIKLTLNGTTQSFGNLGNGFQHLAVTIDSMHNAVQVFKNGISVGTHTFPGSLGNLSDESRPWRLGVHDTGSSLTDYYNGLIDEFAVYDTILSPTQISSHYNESRNIQERGLYVYFPLDEGAGSRVSNSGSRLLNFGTTINAGWSSFAANQVEEPHIFTPVTRQVTLNPSVTSVDQVDFTDRSTVAVSGYVRYKNTDCFAPNVEILVNGASFSPKIFTDSSGKFVIDFDPGSTARLEPKFEDHVFTPAFWDVTNVNSPIAGIIFNDITTRTVSGQVAGGGDCKKSIIEAPAGDAENQGTICVVEVRSVDGCLIRSITLMNQEGNYVFEELPPLERMTVSVVEHSNPEIKNAFQVQGGSTVNLTKNDTIIDFIYFAPPEVEINFDIDPQPGCDPNLLVMEKGELVTAQIRLKEVYVATLTDDGICYLDTGKVQIINGFSDSRLDTTLSGAFLEYKFRVGNPNPSPPYIKTLQIIGTSVPAGRIGSLVKQAIITGTVNKLQTFTTMMPMIPSLILRDPPGDGSSSFMEKTEKVCKTIELSSEIETGLNATTDIEVAPTINFVVAPFGLGKIVTVDPDFQINLESEVTYKKVSSNAFQTCVSFNNRIATNDGDLIVGGARGADLFVGEAINLIFGFADMVTFDTCQVAVKEVLEVEPGNFATTFVYSEFNIRNNVLRYLEDLSVSPQSDSTSKANYNESIDRWEAILALNDSLKEAAALIRNLSFDAGVEYSYSETSDTTDNNNEQNDLNISTKIGTTFGIDFDGVGVSGKINALVKSVQSSKTGNGIEKGLTTGYTLKDDDPGDAFTVDVAMDSVFNTPVFRLKAGQSSCPWEPGSANREGPNLQLAEGAQFTAVNVPSNEPAVFRVNLGNLSATNEDWTYGFTAIAASNPEGAIIKVNGQVLNNNTIQYVVPFGTSIPVTITVERGPIAYEYSDLQIALVSECELARDLALSLSPDSMFFSSIRLGVDFIRPCSEVDINVPEQNWVVLNNDPVQPGTLRRITVSGYDLNSPDFQLVRVQYRRTNGNGTWINLPTPPNGFYEAFNPKWSGFDTIPNHPDTLLLNPNFTQFIWETAGIEDGEYEIHAWAVCSGDASDKPGFSEIIKGKIDRQPPSLIGVPQPSDGVYHVGDEISFTFNQDINCNELIPTSALLFNSETGLEIGSKWTCVGNKIVIDPIDINKEFENKIIRAELQNIQDLTGNIMTSAEWEFYVDRNELAWLTDSLEIVKYVDETKTITAKIHNRGGYPVPYSIINIPEWLHVSPNRGTLVANEIEEIKFTVKDNLGLGEIADNIVLRTETGVNPFFMGGDEPLNIRARNLCRPESWVLDPGGFNTADYSFSMNFVVQLDIEGTLSVDESDVVGAYVGNELRGIGQIEYNADINKYMAFLTVYSNQNSGEQIKFQIWDASECKLYAYALETFSFLADDVKGTIDTCVVLHTNTTLLSKIFIHPGWNWISMNLDLTPNTTNAALASMNSPQGGLIKDQTSFSAYSQIAMGWVGSLNQLIPTSLYQLNALTKDSLSIVGLYIDPTTRNIPLHTGWNWIGYIPTQSLSVNDAMASVSATTGDIIKSQTQFAQYKSGAGWIGNLKYMSPPNGYLLKVANASSLTYPDPFNVNMMVPDQVDLAAKNTVPSSALDQFSEENQLAFWTIDPTKYEYSMNIIATVVEDKNGKNVLHDGDEVGAFVDGEIRGVGKAIHIANTNEYIIFMTAYANVEGEKLNFKYFDASANVDVDVMEKFDFRINKIIGQVDQPEELHIGSTTSNEDLSAESVIRIFPNPFTNLMQVSYNSPKSQDIRLSIQDVNGKLVDVKSLKARSGLNTYEWQPVSGMSAGVYMVFVEGSEGKFSQKVLYVK